MEINLSQHYTSSSLLARPLNCNVTSNFNNGLSTVSSSASSAVAAPAPPAASVSVIDDKRHGVAAIIKTEFLDSRLHEEEAEQQEAEHPEAALEEAVHSEEDGIEVFKFDRNSLKLRCEKISPKQLRANGVTNNKMDENCQSLEVGKAAVKIEKCSSASVSSSSSSSNDSSSDSSDSESSSSSSSSSDSSSSSSSSSNSSNSKSSSDGSSSSSGSEVSDFEDELKKRPKLKVPLRKNNHSKTGKTMVKSDLTTNGTGNKMCRNNKINLERVSLLESMEVKQDVSINEILKIESAEPEEGDDDLEGKINIDDFMEGRNKQRRNSKWADYVGARKSSRLPPRTSFCNKNYETQIKKRLRTLLKKDPCQWTDDDRTTIQSFPKLVAEVENRLQKREVASERLKESEDPPDVLDKKCAQLASVISRARYLIIYTGAGISTSAKIPDYRGPNGIWTLMQKGEEVANSLTDISQVADPTLTHMAIKELWDRGVARHIVSQNVDGLHLRSGIPKTALSEVHGNMYVEVCVKCGREFVRLFDVTENTRRHHHKTGRFCYHCGTPLKDSVVLFGEKGSLRWPLNWHGAEYNADKADVILCLGSSLKVLRRYPWLWRMSEPAAKRPKLYIVNLQWTPKDQFARLKINGKCDEVMEKVMAHLSVPIPTYDRETDSIFTVATSLHPLELDTKSSTELLFPPDLPYPEKNKDLRNYIRFEPVFKVPIPYENGHSSDSKDKSKEPSSSVETEGQSAADNPVSASAIAKKKRVLKGNNSGWLGNAVNVKPTKKRKLK